MGVLQRFERRLEGLVEGAFARAFRSNVQPVEVASALQRETDDKAAIVSQGRTLVPNDFVVELGEADYERLSPYADPLGDELATMVKEHAAEQAYSFVGPVRVRFEQLDELDTGVFRIRSGVAAAATVDGGVVHEGGSSGEPLPAGGPSVAARPRLVLTNGGSVEAGTPAAAGSATAYEITQQTTVLGRGPDCDLRLTDPGVSRRHARLTRQGDHVVRLEDLGSTNGTMINGRPAQGEPGQPGQELHHGDRIELGGTTFTFQWDDAPPAGR